LILRIIKDFLVPTLQRHCHDRDKILYNDVFLNTILYLRQMSSILKHFDTTLIKFNLTSSAIEGLFVEIIEINNKYKSLFPIDLEPTNNGLLQWLKRRVIPKNRAFVESFLAKLGLSVNGTKGIINICKGLSLNDCYWIVDDTFDGSFDKYNLYENRFDRILSTIAYTGYGDTIRSDFASTPCYRWYAG